MGGWRTRRVGRGQLRLAVCLLAVSTGGAFAARPAAAQLFETAPLLRPPNDVPSAPTGTPPRSAPATATSPVQAPPKGPTLQSLPPAAAPGPVHAAPALVPGQGALALSARFGRDYPVINGGLHWRVFRIEQDGMPRVVKEDKAPGPTFVLAPGAYVVSVTFGLASATKAVQVRAEPAKEIVEIPAGGLRIEGRVGDARIPPGQISFELYKGSQFEPGAKRPIVQAVQTGDVILVLEGTYHIVSNYGDANSLVRSDIRVQSGKLTDATVTHRAAVITLKLVNDWGGEARANTQWSVLTPGGDVIKEMSGAFPRVILADGEYRVVARNDDRTYGRSFRVVTGVDVEVEVLAR